MLTDRPATADLTQLDGIRQKVFLDRYSLKDPDGIAIEKYPEEMWDRVAAGIAEVEAPEKRDYWRRRFYEVMQDFKFVPGGRILAGAGTGNQVTLNNCFVIASPPDSRSGIFDSVKEWGEIMSRGGGCGINLSSLRPSGSHIVGLNGTSSGPLAWAEVYSTVTGKVISQGGCFGPDQRIATNLGLIRSEDLANLVESGEEVLALTHRGPRRITYAFRNGRKPLYRVTTARGLTVEVTGEHKMGVLQDGAIATTPLNDLEPGDEVLSLLGDGTGLSPTALRPVEYIRSVMSTNLNEDVRLPTHMDNRLAYFVGYMMGNGSLIQGHKVTWHAPKGINLSIPNARPEIRERLCDYITSLFDLEALVHSEDGEWTNVRVFSRILIEWLDQNGMAKVHAEDVRIPEIIFRSPSEVAGAFVSGYFDADGSDRGRKGGFGFDSVSVGMLRDVQQLLLVNGIASHIATSEQSNPNWRTKHRLVVTGSEFKERAIQFLKMSLKRSKTPGDRNHNNNYPRGVWAALGVPGRYYQGVWDATQPRISFRALSRIQERLASDGRTALAERVGEVLRILPDAVVDITPLGVSEVFDFEVEDVHMLSGSGVYTSNSRRGAGMIMLDDWHPDIESFITWKSQFVRDVDDAGNPNGYSHPKFLEHANVSVCVSDAFMAAVESDGLWDLRFPDMSADRPLYDREWDGDLLAWEEKGYPVKVYKTVRARDIFRLIAESAWKSAEPGLFFIERANKMHPTRYLGRLCATNPCGEIPLEPDAVCNLGSLNLATYVIDSPEGPKFEFSSFTADVSTAVRFLDNQIEASYDFRKASYDRQQQTRRVGLGTMGLADALIMLGMRYGSPESLEIIEGIWTSLRDASYEASVELARERGAFPGFDAEKHLTSPFIQALSPQLQESIREHGLRNSVLNTNAPTGTTSLLAGASSGIEPVFDFVMQRQDRTGTHILYHPLAQAWLDAHPGESLPDYFVNASELTPEEHILVQGAVQRYVDQSISKTCNLPFDSSVEDVEDVYRLAYKLGCKGCTVYRDGSRDAVLTHVEEKKPETPPAPTPVAQTTLRSRPPVMEGTTYRVPTPVGTAFITINSDPDGNPHEVFIAVGRAGSDVAADSEAIGRLISLCLHIPTAIPQAQIVEAIADQLAGIGGSTSLGFGNARVRSLADAVAKVLTEHVSNNRQSDAVIPEFVATDTSNRPRVTGDFCPSCGQIALVHEEGCRKCFVCGYSAC